MTKTKKRLSASFQKWLFLIVAIAFVITLVFLWGYQTKLFTDSAENLLDVYIKDVKQDIADTADKNLLVITHAVATELNGTEEITGELLLKMLVKYNVSEINYVNASGAENGFFEKWAGYQASVNTQKVKFAKLNQYLGMIPSLVSTLTNTAVLIIGVYLTMEGSFTVGMVMAFQGFLGSFMAPAQQLISASQTLQEMRAEMECIEDVMKYPTDVICEQAADEGEDAEFDKLSGNVEMRSRSPWSSSRFAPLCDTSPKRFPWQILC